MFRKYPSIDQSYNKRTIKEIGKFGFDIGDWVVTNKVHGANFSIWCDGENIVCGKRKSFISDDDNFYGYKEVVKDYKDRIINITRKSQDLLNDDIVMVFYCEFFGGTYPHPEVKAFPHATKVQKGVFYCPHNDLYFFDIVMGSRFLSHDAVEKICKENNFIYAKPLFRGSFEECLNFDPVFEDPVYKFYGLPKIEDNVSEGVVLKPVIPAFFPNGSRCILKNKNPKFIEKTRKKKKVKEELPQHIKDRIESVSQYVTENRLRNVLSHGLEIGQKDFGKIMKAFVLDIIEEYEKENGSIHLGLEDKKEAKIISKALNKMCSDLIRPHFINIVNGEF